MNETNWKPTEEELLSLGFVNNGGWYEIAYEDDCFDNASIWYSVGGAFGISINSTEVHHADWFVHLKSLEELRTLIAMMKP